MAKSALISGVTGQHGVCSPELLLSKGYIVHGIKMRVSSFNTEQADHLYKGRHERFVKFSMRYEDMTDSAKFIRPVQETQPDEIYNLPAQSHVHVSFETPEHTANTNAVGVRRLLEASRIHKLEKAIRFYQAATSERHGLAHETPHKETNPFYRCSPYAAAKLYGCGITVNYQEAYGMHASNGILSNHEGPARVKTFVTRKITGSIAAIHLGLRQMLYIGNINAKRDWEHARDCVEGIWLILLQKTPDDYVLAAGEANSMREFLELAFAEVVISTQWRGKGVKEKRIDAASGRVLVQIDRSYFRPTEVDILMGDVTKARKKLKWKHKTGFRQRVSGMVAADLKKVAKESGSRMY